MSAPPPTLGLILHRGWHDELITALNAAAAAAVGGRRVRLLFSGWMLERLARGRLGEVRLDPNQADRLADYCRARGLDGPIDPEIESTLASLKTLGDVRMYACSAACALYGIGMADLPSWVDERIGTTHFLLEEASDGPVLFL